MRPLSRFGDRPRGADPLARAGRHGAVRLLRLPYGSRPGDLPLGSASLTSLAMKTGRDVAATVAARPASCRPERHHAELRLVAGRRSKSSRTYLFNQSVPWDLAKTNSVGGRGADRRCSERQEALRRIALHLLPYGGREGERLSPRAFQGRVVRHALAGCWPSCANRTPSIPRRRCRATASPSRIAGRRRLPGRRAPRLRGPEGDAGTAPREPDPGRERGEAVPAHGACRLPPGARGSEEKFGPE